jgi:hypothetical protein
VARTATNSTKTASDPRLTLCVVPAVLIGVLYELCLGPRHDYTGHFLAGYAASLGAAAVWLKTLSAERYARWSTQSLVPGCFICILIGAFLEATAFRIAKFDEIDFCNQSLGSVLAAVIAAAYSGDVKPADAVFDHVTIVAVILLGIGAFFAVA